MRVKVGGAGAREGAAGPIALRPEDSPFYHPTLNPTGAPPPSKAGSMAGLQASKAPNVPALPVPKPPPLPAGPKPSLPPPPSASVLAKASMEQWLEPPAQPLPPPEGPPPPLLPPPDVAPPGFKLPPPPMPPPGRLPPPPGPPPGTHSQEDSGRSSGVLRLLLSRVAGGQCWASRCLDKWLWHSMCCVRMHACILATLPQACTCTRMVALRHFSSM